MVDRRNVNLWGEPTVDEGQGQRAVTYDELLVIREESWAKRLATASLVAEQLVCEQHAEQALTGLALRYRKAADSYQRCRVLSRWPAVQVMTTVSVAANHFVQGSLWPALSERVGSEGQTFQREWGDAFLANLRRLSLPAFTDIEDPGLKYLGPILMHSGVPTYCLGDYYRLVTDRRSRTPGLSPTEFVSWAAARAVAGQLYNVDKPVERFLRYGGDYAIDVTDRVFELLDVVAAGGNADDVQLPPRFRSTAVDLRNQGALQPTHRHHEGSPGRSLLPRLVIDPYGRGLLLRLPSADTGAADQATWSVTLGTTQETVRSRALWPGEAAPELDVPIPVPLRSATAALLGHEEHLTNVLIVDDKDPLLAFGEDGEQLPPGLPLRGAVVWLLFPGPPEDLRTQGELEIIAQGALPPGWASWSLVLVSLHGLTAVRAPVSERWRTVRSVAAVRIAPGEPIPGLLSRAGAPVFAQPPEILLPAGLSVETVWTASVSDEGGETLVGRHQLDPGDTAALWACVPRPLLGSYTIRIRGPWGRGAAREVFVAEGVSVQSTPPWRRINGRGLIPATVKLATTAGVHLDSEIASLGEHQLDAQVGADARGVASPLIVRPPHMTISYQSELRSAAPAIYPVPLATEELRESHGVLVVDLGEAGAPQLHALAGTIEVQLIEPSGGARNGVYRFDLNRLTDTLVAHPRLRLALDPGGELVVATVTPRRLFSRMDLVGAELWLQDAPNVEGMTALAYLARAPWVPAAALPIREGRAVLPLRLADAGPLVVHVRVEDPWLPQPVPVWAPLDSIVLPSQGWYRGDSPAETALSSFLAGAGPFPEGEADLEWIWAILARAQSLRLDARFVEVAQACSKELRDDPTGALLALRSVPIDAHRLPEVLVRSGLLALPSDQVASRARIDWSEATALSATLVSAGRLRSLNAESEELATARVVCGDVLDQLLVGHDPYPKAGRLDASADRYALLEPEIRDEFKRATRLVPKGLLELDSRVLAVFQLLDNKDDAPRWLVEKAGRSLAELLSLLSGTGDEAGQAAVRARLHPSSKSGWRALSALSLGWAWVARSSAHGEHRHRGWIEGQKQFWGDLARLAPQLVTIDVILADLLVRAHRTHDPEELP